MTTGIDINYVTNRIQSILDKSHTIPQKKVIKSYPNKTNPNKLSFACAICGDSDKNPNKKRGDLWLNSMMYTCYNCGEKMSFVKLCDIFDEPIDPDVKLALYEQLNNNIRYNRTAEYAVTSLDKLLTMDDLLSLNNRKDSSIREIEPIIRGSLVHKYLESRLIFDYSCIYQANYYHSPTLHPNWKEPVALILNMGGDRILSLQARNLKHDKEKRLYRIYDFEELYNTIKKKELDRIEAIPYNKLSHFHNILNINFEDTVTIFEGYFDSTFYPNSIGSIGTNTDVDFLLNSEEEMNVQFFYDFDTAGNKKSYEKIIKGHNVFLWNKFLNDSIKRKKDPERSKIFFKKNVKDLNDLALFSKQKNVHRHFKLQNYFSIDEFDKLYIDLVEEKFIGKNNKQYTKRT